MSAATPPAADSPKTASALGETVPADVDFKVAVLAAAMATIVTAGTLLVDPSYFLAGDSIEYFRPGFHEIARLVVHGQVPLLTDRLWDGGALLQEYQYAVFNPVSLLLYVAISAIGDLSAGAAVYSLVHIAILAAGVYALCRAFGCLPRHAFLAGAVAPLSDWIFFWGATQWIPALVSLAWLVWAWTLLILAWRRRAFAPAAAMAVALTLLSGWPFADLALLVSVLVAARVLFVGSLGRNLRQAAWPALALAAGSLMAMPAILPLLFYAAYSQRQDAVAGWEASLSNLLTVGMPLVQTHWAAFAEDVIVQVQQPIVYGSWFAPLALAGANWRVLATDRRVWIVLGSALAFGALSMIPHIGLLRWMFRLLPYYQLSLIVAAAIALTQADKEGVTWKFDRLVLVIAAETWLAFSQNRSLAFAYLGLAYAIGVLAWISVRFGGRRDARWTAMALAASVGVFALTVLNLAWAKVPHYPQPWRQAHLVPISPMSDARGPERLYVTNQLSKWPDPGPTFWTTYRVKNTSLYGPGTSITGYSPMILSAYVYMHCALRHGDRCDEVVDYVLAPVRPTGRGILDLMGVGEVDFQKPGDAARFSARAGGGWTESGLPDGGRRFERPSREGQVTWASPDVSGTTRDAGLTRIVLDARNDAAAPGMLIVARAWYPTWHASLNGIPIHAEPLDEVLVAIDLPAKSRGRLVLSFWPDGLTLGLALAAIGAVLAVMPMAFPRLLEAPAARLEARLRGEAA